MGGKGDSDPKMRVTHYYMSIFFGICQGPIDSLWKIKIKDKVAWKGDRFEEGRFIIDKGDLFGGREEGGGAVGNVHYQPGNWTQKVASVLASKIDQSPTPDSLPGFRGIATAFLTKGEYGGKNASGSNQIKSKAAKDGKGFYWGSNSPYVPKIEFGVSRYCKSWYPATAAIGKAESTPRAVFFAIDASGSMDDNNRVDLVLDAMALIFEQFRNQIRTSGLNIHLGLCVWNDSSTQDDWPAATVEDIDAAEAWLERHLNPRSGTNFRRAAAAANTFFAKTLDVVYDRRLMFFITDGLATGTQDDARDDMSDILDRSQGDYSIAAGTAVDCYGINIDLEDTGETDNLDNTEGTDKDIKTNGYVPVIEDGESGELAKIVRTALGGGAQLDANPAHVIYECLTDTTWGLGAPPQQIHDASFREAADTLVTESFGLSLLWSEQATIEEFVQEVLDHIEAMLYVDPTDGLFHLKLIRDDYDPDTLPVFDESNCTVESYSMVSTAEAINQIDVSWTNPENEKEETVTIQDLGGIVRANGQINPDTRNYYGVRYLSLAWQLAQRDISVASARLATAKIDMDRSAWKLVPGSVFKLTSSQHRVQEEVMRVMKINRGRPGESTIRVEATQDIFSFERPVYEQPPDSEGDEGVKEPVPFTDVQFLTLPYFLIGYLANARAQAQGEYPEVLTGLLPATTNSDAIEYRLYAPGTDVAGNQTIEEIGPRDIVARGAISEDFAAEAQTLTEGFTSLTAGDGPTQGGFGLIGGPELPPEDMEIVLFSEWDGTAWTLLRGALDTTPRDWPTGTAIRFFDTETRMVDSTVRTVGVETDYRLLMRTSLGSIDPGLVGPTTYAPNDRPYLPTRPANVQILGQGFGVVDAEGVNPVTVTWANRNRVTEDSQVLAWGADSITPEEGQTTSLVILDPQTGTEINRVEGLTGTTHDLSVSAFNGYSRAIVKAVAVRDDMESLTGHEIEVLLAAGYGYNYGNVYGR